MFVHGLAIECREFELLPQDVELQCCFILRRYFHQGCKSKHSFFPGPVNVLRHNFCKIHKLKEKRQGCGKNKTKRSEKLEFNKMRFGFLLVTLTWKLSKALAGMLSSNSFIMSHGPSPTPTKIIDKGYSLQIDNKHVGKSLS